MLDNKSKEEKALKKSSDKFMEKVEKAEKKEAEILRNCRSNLQYQTSKMIRKICEQQKIKGAKKIREVLDMYSADLSEYKNGKKEFTLERLEDIAKRLNVSPYHLLGVTDNPKPIPIVLSSMIYGLTLDARYSLLMLYYGMDEDYNNIEAEIVDNETGEIDINVLPSGEYLENFEILSDFIADFSNFCDFFTYIKRYVEVKQEINKLKTNENHSNLLQKNKLDEDIQEIKRRIQKSIYESLDKIADKK